MNHLSELGAEARTRRAELLKTMGAVRRRLSLPELAEDAVAVLDPQLAMLGRVKSGIQRNPLLATALLAGAAWLVSGASRPGRGLRQARTRDKRLKPNRNPRGEEQ